MAFRINFPVPIVNSVPELPPGTSPELPNRYKSIFCQVDPYLREVVRYIHLNPLRAKLVAALILRCFPPKAELCRSPAVSVRQPLRRLQNGVSTDSAHPQMANLPNIGFARKI